MKLREQFTVAQLADDYVAVSLNGSGSFRGVIKLNESGAEVFQGLIDGQDEKQLAERLMAKYPELDSETAKKAVAEVIDNLKNAGILDV